MEKINEWQDALSNSLSTMGEELGKVIPNLLGALAILIIGWILTKLVVSVVRKALKLAKANKLDDKINEIELFEGKKLSFDTIKIVTKFIKYVMYIILIIMITDVLNLTMISEEIKNLLRYLPRLFSALAIFTIGLLLANAIKKAIKSFFESMDLSGSKIISQVVFMILLVFISITTLNQAGVNTDVITSNITMILAAFLLAFAIAFGLGAQKVVGDLLRTFYARKTYEIGQKIKFGDIEGEVESIDSIMVVLKTKDGKQIIPIKDLVESQVHVKSQL